MRPFRSSGIEETRGRKRTNERTKYMKKNISNAGGERGPAVPRRCQISSARKGQLEKEDVGITGADQYISISSSLSDGECVWKV